MTAHDWSPTATTLCTCGESPDGYMLPTDSAQWHKWEQWHREHRDSQEDRPWEQAEAIQRVRDLHRPGVGHLSNWCLGCSADCEYCEGDHEYPCPTIIALDGPQKEK